MPPQKKINTIQKRKPVVLIAPLDWGLGHATRCIPIISILLSAGFEVIVASEGKQKALLQAEFPFIRHLDLEGYRLEYGKNSWQTKAKIFMQLPKILTAIKREKKWLQSVLEAETIDAIISDNRFGFHHASVPCIFITHQLWIYTGMSAMVNKMLQKWNYFFIEKFSECWVPDEKDEPSLGGNLSHPEKLPAIPVRYIGPLSRFTIQANLPNEKLSLLIILSGPEPQRSLFEKIVLRELTKYPLPAVVVRGLPGETTYPKTFNAVRIFNHLETKEFNDLALAADIVISRSGYSTVMDMLPLGKKCIFVPTPGQGEQEYLSRYLSEKKLCIAMEQDKFSLQKGMEEAKKLNPASYRFDLTQISQAVNEFAKSLNIQ